MIDTKHDSFKRLADTLGIGQYKKKCPECRDSRTKNTSDSPLSIKVSSDGVQYTCHHCDANGGWMHSHATDIFDFPEATPQPVSEGIDGNKYLLNRGISQEIIDEYTVTGMYTFNGRPTDAVGFPYRANDIEAVKWRSTDKSKAFSQHNVCEDFYLLETYQPGNSILICEGELDALAWLTAGVPDDVTVLSVPNGAPSLVKEGRVAPSEDKKFSYVWRAKSQLLQAPRIYLNTDNDGPGRALQEELSRRIGKAKIWIVDLADHKDAAEALDQKSPQFLTDRLEGSTPLPMVGLHGANDFDTAYTDLYESGGMQGASVGIQGIDALMSIPLGMISVCTGFPGSGKSDLIDQFCLNMARDYGWKTIFCSFEKPPTYHIAQLSQKLVGRNFFKGTEREPRMTEAERDYGKDFCDEHFMFMDASKGAPTDIEGILDMASAAVMRMGCRLLVIDPYNYISVDRNAMETDAISDMMSKVRIWALEHDAHVFFVAHPAKPAVRGDRYICSGLDVSKSMAWFAKADIGWTTWRGPDNEAEFHVWKVRWGWMGTVGHCGLSHDVASSRWTDGHGFADGDQWGSTDYDF